MPCGWCRPRAHSLVLINKYLTNQNTRLTGQVDVRGTLIPEAQGLRPCPVRGPRRSGPDCIPHMITAGPETQTL